MIEDARKPPRRERLVAVALDMFTRYGVRRTSIEDIAREAKIAKGSVYLEFRTKEDLFRAAAEHLVAELLAAATAAAAREGRLDDRLTEVLFAKFWRMYDLVHSRPHARELVEAKDAVAADLFRAADDRYANLVVGALGAAIRRREWRPHPHHAPREIANVLLRAAHGTAYGAGRLTAAAFRRRLHAAVVLILAGAAQR